MPQLRNFRDVKIEEMGGGLECGKWEEKTRKGGKKRTFKNKRRGC